MNRNDLFCEKKLLDKQMFWLDFSKHQCSCENCLCDEGHLEEVGHYETLCSRYFRGVDFLLRDAFKGIDEFELEKESPLLEMIDRTHERGLVSGLDQLRQMKSLHDTVLYEYDYQEFMVYHNQILENTNILLDMMGKTSAYMAKMLAS